MENSKKSSLRELHGARLMGFSMGFFGIMLLLMLTESYSYNFYVYTIRLDSILVSIGSTISILSGGFSSIIFGVILDNTKPKKIGKRRPYILIGLPVWLISTILIYFPPWLPPGAEITGSTVLFWPLAIWYWVLKFLKSVFGGLMMIVFSSILPEISQSLQNRKKAAMVATNLQIVCSIVSIAFPNIIQSLLEDPTETGYWTNSGMFVMNAMPNITIIFSIISVILILIAFLSIDESFHLTEKDFEKRSLVSTFKNIFKPTKDKEYMKFMTAGVMSQTSQFVLGFTIIPFIAFVLGRYLPSGEVNFLYIMYIIISISTKYSWLLIWRFIMRKKENLLKTYKLNLIVMIIAAVLELFFFFNMHIFLRIILFVLSFGTVLGSMYSTALFRSPLMSEMIDRAAENSLIENRNGDKNQAVTRISGSYFGLFSLTSSIIAAISSTIFGFIFQGDNSRNPIILTLGLMSMGLFYVIALFALQILKVKFRDSK
ncbi:MAG: MFS transporter [Promethearchaeota archaeon]